jgi:hypothetical protein
MRRAQDMQIASTRSAWRLVHFGAVSIAIGIAGPACAERIADMDAGVSYDNNVSNGKFRSDVHGDLALEASTSQGVVSQFTDSNSVSATADLRGQSYTRFEGLNNLSLGGSLGYRDKFGVGALAPWISATLSAARLEYQNSVRNGWQYNAGMRAGKRLDERWNVGAEISYDRRTADHTASLVPGISGAVYDINGRSAGINAGYAWSNKLLLSTSYTFREGDVVSTTRPNPGIFFSSEAVAQDPAFGPGEFAYRLHAAAQILALRASQAVGRNSSLNLGFLRQLTRGDGGNNYVKNVVDLSYLYSF